jgi:hypothetical protein
VNQVNRSPIVENLEKVLSTTIKSLPTNDASQYKVYREVIDTINDFKLQLQDLLEFTSKNVINNQEKYRRLYALLTQQNANELCEKLRGYGFLLRYNQEIYEKVYDPEKKKARGLVFRILELTRLGKKEEVFYSIFNIFQGYEISSILVRAFNPVYSEDLFKVFIYSFLSGLLGEKKGFEEEEG